MRQRWVRQRGEVHGFVCIWLRQERPKAKRLQVRLCRQTPPPGRWCEHDVGHPCEGRAGKPLGAGERSAEWASHATEELQPHQPAARGISEDAVRDLPPCARNCPAWPEAEVLHSARIVHVQCTLQCTSKNLSLATVHVESEWETSYITTPLRFNVHCCQTQVF